MYTSSVCLVQTYITYTRSTASREGKNIKMGGGGSFFGLKHTAAGACNRGLALVVRLEVRDLLQTNNY
jgi:hypothetical protein